MILSTGGMPAPEGGVPASEGGLLSGGLLSGGWGSGVGVEDGAWSRGVPGPRGVPGGDPPGRLLLRAVRILLECILVSITFLPAANKVAGRQCFHRCLSVQLGGVG